MSSWPPARSWKASRRSHASSAPAWRASWRNPLIFRSISRLVVPGAASGGGRIRRSLQAALSSTTGLLGLQLSGDAHEGLLREFRSGCAPGSQRSSARFAGSACRAASRADNLGGFTFSSGSCGACHQVAAPTQVFHAPDHPTSGDRNTILRRFHVGATPLLCHVARRGGAATTVQRPGRAFRLFAFACALTLPTGPSRR